MAELSKPLFNPFQALLDYEKNSAKLLGPKIHCPLHTSQLQLRLNSNEERKQQQRQEEEEEEEEEETGYVHCVYMIMDTSCDFSRITE